MFGMIIFYVFSAWSPEDSKLPLFDYVVYPIETHILGLWFLLAKLLCCNAHWSGIVNLNSRGPCFCPISVMLVWIGTVVWALTKMVSYSASAADAMMLIMIFHTTTKMPLTVGTKYSGFFGLGGPSLRKWTPLARLLAWETDRYDALEYMYNCIPLALYWISVCGLEAIYFSILTTCLAMLFVALDWSEEMLMRVGRILLSIVMA